MRFFPFVLYFKHLPNALLLAVGALMNAVIWGWLLWQIRPQEQLLFLHYNVLFGVDRIGPWWRVFELPLIGLLVLLVNALIGWYFFEKDKTVGYILNVVTIVAHVYLAVGAYLLVFLNV